MLLTFQAALLGLPVSYPVLYPFVEHIYAVLTPFDLMYPYASWVYSSWSGLGLVELHHPLPYDHQRPLGVHITVWCIAHWMALRFIQLCGVQLHEDYLLTIGVGPVLGSLCWMVILIWCIKEDFIVILVTSNHPIDHFWRGSPALAMLQSTFLLTTSWRSSPVLAAAMSFWVVGTAVSRVVGTNVSRLLI